MVIFDQIGRVLGSASPIGALWVSQNGHLLIKNAHSRPQNAKNAKNPREWQTIEGLGVQNCHFRPKNGHSRASRNW